VSAVVGERLVVLVISLWEMIQAGPVG
jgi:hypothetical protein